MSVKAILEGLKGALGSIEAHKKLIEESLAHARSLEKEGAEATVEQRRAATDRVRELRAELAKMIAEGADPCPLCDSEPIGIEQATDKGTAFEIGCPTCRPFRSDDGTVRQPRARGFGVPVFAVAEWNKGPSGWLLGRPHHVDAIEAAEGKSA